MVRENSDLPQYIKSQMFMKKLDQRKLAAKMGLTQATLNNKINRKSDFTFTEIILLMNFLGLNFNGVFIK